MPNDNSLAWIWSNQHGQWWRPNRRGYTAHIHEAGRYTWDEAAQIVIEATCDGALVRDRVDPVTGEGYTEVEALSILR